MAHFLKFRPFSISVLALILLASCQRTELERQQVPIMWGMRYENANAEADINGNLAEMRKLVLRQMVLEIPLIADSAGLPYIPHFPLSTTLTLLRQYKTRLHLALTTIEDEQLFPNGSIADPDAWFAALEHQTDSILAVIADYPPERVIIGNNWLPMENYPDHYGRMLNRLRKSHTNFFSYSAQLNRLDKVPLWAASDEISIDYTPSALANHKEYARTHNASAGKIAQAHQKSIFIFRANILGTDPVLQLKNRLRFWPEDRSITGICINTIYSRIAARDSSSYYGLRKSANFFQYLDKYRRPPE